MSLGRIALSNTDPKRAHVMSCGLKRPISWGKKSKNRLVCKNDFAFGLLWELQTPSKGLLAQLRVCWLRGKNTLPVALPGVQLVREEATLPASSWFLLGSSYAECYGQLLAGLGKGGKLESSIKPEEQTSTLNRRGLQSLSIVL